MSAPTDSDSAYKEQASRLQTFLAKNGVELKHTHALEAVAQMHGAKNWHTLRNSAIQNDTASLQASPWLICTYGQGHFPCATILTSLPIALNAFLKKAYIYASLLPNATLRVIGEEVDAAFEGLFMFCDGILTVSMTRPAQEELQEGSSQYVFPEPEQFSNIASLIEAAVHCRTRENLEELFERVRRSEQAYQITFNIDEAIRELPDEQPQHIKPADISPKDAEMLWRTMQQIRTWHQTEATLVTTTDPYLRQPGKDFDQTMKSLIAEARREDEARQRKIAPGPLRTVFYKTKLRRQAFHGVLTTDGPCISLYTKNKHVQPVPLGQGTKLVKLSHRDVSPDTETREPGWHLLSQHFTSIPLLDYSDEQIRHLANAFGIPVGKRDGDYKELFFRSDAFFALCDWVKYHETIAQEYVEAQTYLGDWHAYTWGIIRLRDEAMNSLYPDMK